MKQKSKLEPARAARPAKMHLRRPPKTVAAAGTNPGTPPGKGLRASLHLQQQLRQLTHRFLVAQEEERGQLSHELRDEIAQTLLGLNVRLLLLQQAARSKAKGLKNEIANTQRLVVRSALLVQRLARKLKHHRPTPSELKAATI